MGRLIVVGAMLVVGLLSASCDNQPSSSGHEIGGSQTPSPMDQPSSDIASDDLVLRMFIWDGYAPEQHVRKFEKHVEATYGRKLRLEIELTEGGDTDFFDPIRNKAVDVVTLTHHLFKDERFGYVGKKMLLPLDLENIPNFDHLIPSLQSADFHTDGGEIYGVPICQGPYGLAYNLDLVPTAPTSWNILWDPAYQGTYIVAANEFMYNINITALAMGYPRASISSYDALNNDPFKLKLRQLAVNAHSFWVGADKPDDLSGRSLGAIWGDSIGGLLRRGERWALAVPVEGTPYWIDNYAITWALADDPFRKKLAEEWINMLLELDYQVDYIVREITLVPVVDDIEDVLTPAEAERLYASALESSYEQRIPQTMVSSRDRNGLQKLWREAMEGITVVNPD